MITVGCMGPGYLHRLYTRRCPLPPPTIIDLNRQHAKANKLGIIKNRRISVSHERGWAGEGGRESIGSVCREGRGKKRGGVFLAVEWGQRKGWGWGWGMGVWGCFSQLREGNEMLPHDNIEKYHWTEPALCQRVVVRMGGMATRPIWLIWVGTEVTMPRDSI